MKYLDILEELDKWKPVPPKSTTPTGYREADNETSACSSCYFFTRSYMYRPGRGGCSYYSREVEEHFTCERFFTLIGE